MRRPNVEYHIEEAMVAHLKTYGTVGLLGYCAKIGEIFGWRKNSGYLEECDVVFDPEPADVPDLNAISELAEQQELDASRNSPELFMVSYTYASHHFYYTFLAPQPDQHAGYIRGLLQEDLRPQHEHSARASL